MNAKRVLSQQWREKSLKVIKSKWKLADVTTTTKKVCWPDNNAKNIRYLNGVYAKVEVHKHEGR